jgi:hypothetical protein
MSMVTVEGSICNSPSFSEFSLYSTVNLSYDLKDWSDKTVDCNNAAILSTCSMESLNLLAFRDLQKDLVKNWKETTLSLIRVWL